MHLSNRERSQSRMQNTAWKGLESASNDQNLLSPDQGPCQTLSIQHDVDGNRVE